jgi:hypothetical protein
MDPLFCGIANRPSDIWGPYYLQPCFLLMLQGCVYSVFVIFLLSTAIYNLCRPDPAKRKKKELEAHKPANGRGEARPIGSIQTPATESAQGNGRSHGANGHHAPADRDVEGQSLANSEDSEEKSFAIATATSRAISLIRAFLPLATLAYVLSSALNARNEPPTVYVLAWVPAFAAWGGHGTVLASLVAPRGYNKRPGRGYAIAFIVCAVITDGLLAWTLIAGFFSRPLSSVPVGGPNPIWPKVRRIS